LSSSLERRPVGPIGTAVANGIDKSRLAYPEPRRFRDKEHVRFVAKQPCLICGRTPTDPHHLRFARSYQFPLDRGLSIIIRSDGCCD
jgi:hypothetical protein